VTLGDWQRRRSEFNHDWLKLKYLNRLKSFFERLQVEDSGSMSRLREFIEMDFPVWEERSMDAWWLVQHFEKEMSPSSLFNTEPLNKCGVETKEWLVPLIHALWLERRSVRQLVTKAAELLATVDEDFMKLSKNLPKADDAYIQRLKSDLPVWKKFVDDCFEFSQCLSDFPHGIEVL
jgi:hypothetical protein